MRNHVLLWTWCLAACGPGADTDALDTDHAVSSEVLLIHELRFARDEAGVSVGVDLDGASSTAGGGTGCGVADLVAPDGASGIDNSFAGLLPALEAIGAEAIEPLVQAAVDSGELLLLIEMDDRRDPVDGCVRVGVSRGVGEATVGGLGRIVAGQTFDRSNELDESVVACATVEDGTVVGSPFELRLPLTIFDESIDLTLLDGVIHVVPREDGSWGGFVSGGVAVDELQANIDSLDGVSSAITNLAMGALDVRADLAPDDSGTCQRMSVVMRFETVSAYFFE